MSRASHMLLATGLLVAVRAPCVAPHAADQQKAIEFDLATLAANDGLRLFNRSVSILSDGTARGIRLSEVPGDGAAWLEGVDFSNGVIELDIRGKDVPQQSFLGVAFHAADTTTYDAVYFRPFNFRTDDPARRQHGVQYISHPTYTWYKLRTEHPNSYEQAIDPAPDPNGWFHVRIVVASPKVSVFVGDAAKPSLVVNQLSDRGNGRVGLFVGNNSGGDFANLKIVPR
jgi:hypothetical protein